MGNKRGSAAPAGKGGGKGKTAAEERRVPVRADAGSCADVRGELRRVSWPDRDQLSQSTAVVLIIVLTLAAYVAAWDFVFTGSRV